MAARAWSISMLAPMSCHSSSPSGVFNVSAISQTAPVADSVAMTAWLKKRRPGSSRKTHLVLPIGSDVDDAVRRYEQRIGAVVFERRGGRLSGGDHDLRGGVRNHAAPRADRSADDRSRRHAGNRIDDGGAARLA
jgi:hypothetical protein